MFPILYLLLPVREVAKYDLWQIEAQTAQTGIHNESARAGAIRNVSWTIEDPRALFDELKGAPQKGNIHFRL